MNNPSISTNARCVNTAPAPADAQARCIRTPNTIGCTFPKIAANDTPSESSSTGAAHAALRGGGEDEELARETPRKGGHAKKGDSCRELKPHPRSG